MSRQSMQGIKNGWAGLVVLTLGCLAVPLVQADQATIFQCKDKNGAVIFSGTPCGPDAKTRTIEAPSAGTGGAAARQGIDDLAKQYDHRQAQARQEAAEAARAEAAARARAEAAPPPPPPIHQEYYYGGYLPPGGYYRSESGGIGGSINSRGEWSIRGYAGDRDGDRGRSHRHPPPPTLPSQLPASPGISGRFPGGLPGMRQ